MALITIVGFPCSGKSTRAQQIQEYLEKRIRSESEGGAPKLGVMVIDDDNSHVPRSTYDTSLAEKPGRANLFSNLTRNLGPEQITICDSLNYIKGFRYQMYCAAREAHCRVCTIHVIAPPEKCTEWHEKRGECSYKPATFDNLLMRFEEPSSMVRWDSPLISIPWDEDPPFEEIWNVVMKGEKKGPTAATLQRSKPPPNALHTLTNTTSTITSSLLTHLSAMPTASTFPIPSPPAADRTLLLHLPMRRVTLPEMQRLKRQYESVQTKAVDTNSRAAEVWTEEGVARGFVAFLETAWDTDE